MTENDQAVHACVSTTPQNECRTLIHSILHLKEAIHIISAVSVCQSSQLILYHLQNCSQKRNAHPTAVTEQLIPPTLVGRYPNFHILNPFPHFLGYTVLLWLIKNYVVGLGRSCQNYLLVSLKLYCSETLHYTLHIYKRTLKQQHNI